MHPTDVEGIGQSADSGGGGGEHGIVLNDRLVSLPRSTVNRRGISTCHDRDRCPPRSVAAARSGPATGAVPSGHNVWHLHPGRDLADLGKACGLGQQ